MAATKADPENEDLLHVLGSFSSRTRKTDEFAKLYQDLLKRKPDSLVAKKGLAELSLAKNAIKKVKEYVEQLLNASPDDVDGCYFRGRIYLREKDVQKANDDFAVVARDGLRFALANTFSGRSSSGSVS